LVIQNLKLYFDSINKKAKILKVKYTPYHKYDYKSGNPCLQYLYKMLQMNMLPKLHK